MTTRPPLRDVLARHTAPLMALPGVTGTGEGRRGNESVFIVYVSHATEKDRLRIPEKVEGYEVEIREIGDVTAPPR